MKKLYVYYNYMFYNNEAKRGYWDLVFGDLVFIQNLFIYRGFIETD
jgi:hypothetical protein